MRCRSGSAGPLAFPRGSFDHPAPQASPERHVSTAGIRSDGKITEADITEVVRRHLDDQCRLAASLGVPRDRLFTHSGGWKEGELLYSAAVNRFSCPGWSFYRHALNPQQDAGVQADLKRSDAPYWAAVEWLYQGPRQTQAWRRALEATLSDRRCRYLCIYNWESVQSSKEVIEAVRQVVAAPQISPDEKLGR